MGIVLPEKQFQFLNHPSCLREGAADESDDLGAVSGVGGKDSPMIPAGPSTTPRCKSAGAERRDSILLSPVLRNDADVTFGLFAAVRGVGGATACNEIAAGAAGSKYR